MKLEGRTLVNLYENKQKDFHKYYILTGDEKINLSLFKPNTVYTAIILDETEALNRYRETGKFFSYKTSEPEQ